jgi:hypothetical protein
MREDQFDALLTLLRTHTAPGEPARVDPEYQLAALTKLFAETHNSGGLLTWTPESVAKKAMALWPIMRAIMEPGKS